MARVDVMDETFLVVAPRVLAAEFASPAAWRALWPDLDLAVFTDRGEQGIRWSVTGPAWTGSMEVWLEPVHFEKERGRASCNQTKALTPNP